MTHDPFVVSVPSNGPGGVYTWDSQARFYPATGEPGITYFAGETPQGTVNCLLYYNFEGQLVGILNHYPVDFPPWEKAGAINVWTHHEHRRRGIASQLVEDCRARWGIDAGLYRYTPEGAALGRKVRERRLDREAQEVAPHAVV